MPYSTGVMQRNYEETRKRKRKSEKGEASPIATTAAVVCFTNAAFSNSSTPKKLIRRRKAVPTVKENSFMLNAGLEVKSIADIVSQNAQRNGQQEQSLETNNPYEVVRKPPKKKKKQHEIEEACFENPALNLETVEKQFNPFEVQRVETINTKGSQCFVNKALNIRAQEPAITCNPFEIQRHANNNDACSINGVENAGLDDAIQAQQSGNLKIVLPFKPTVGCRIDFNNISPSQLTPSKLLAEKLVFSPLVGPKRSLGSIGEESTMDIGKELDRYQLELENSINEAKLRKNTESCEENKKQELTLQVELEQKITFTQKLAEIIEDDEENEEKSIRIEVIETKDILNSEQKIKLNNMKELCCSLEKIVEASRLDEEAVSEETVTPKECEATTEEYDSKNDVTYASESEEDQYEEDDFKTPAPFVRAYRRADVAYKLSSKSKESLNSNHSENMAEHKNTSNVQNFLRKSLRKLMHPHHKNNNELPKMKEEEPTKQQHTNIVTSIRNSLRRKPHKDSDQLPLATLDISIIDSSERTIKLKSNQPQTEYAKIEELTNEKKHTLRNSIRRSTREIRKQFMKSVFHKDQEDYAFH